MPTSMQQAVSLGMQRNTCLQVRPCIALRQMALTLGRKNFLWVGNNGAGHNLAVLQSLVSSCQINGVDPQAYLADIMIRIQDHPQSQIDELLPNRWQPP